MLSTEYFKMPLANCRIPPGEVPDLHHIPSYITPAAEIVVKQHKNNIYIFIYL
jgi:hypothetical protein